MSHSQLFGEIFNITEVDPDGKYFDKITRFRAESIQGDIRILIDINTDIYPLNKDEHISLVLTSNINLDDSPDKGVYIDISREKTLVDDYEYCMYGKVFKYEYKEGNKVLIYISFGGLLMSIEGEQSPLENIKYGSRLYLLIKKTN